jgi:hypothetical protein
MAFNPISALTRAMLDVICHYPPTRGLAAAIMAEGQATAERLLAARRQCLGQLVEDWQPDGDAALNAAIDRLARELGREAPVAV